MKCAIFFTLCLSAWIFLKSASKAWLYIYIYRHRTELCIERIVKQQKACDLLNMVYSILLMAMGFCMSVECLLLVINKECSEVFNMLSLAVITVAYIACLVLNLKMQNRYDLKNFYDNMVDYRSKQEVVTAENDYEVSFIRSYQEVNRYKIKNNVFYVVFSAVLLYMLLIK